LNKLVTTMLNSWPDQAIVPVLLDVIREIARETARDEIAKAALERMMAQEGKPRPTPSPGMVAASSPDELRGERDYWKTYAEDRDLEIAAGRTENDRLRRERDTSYTRLVELYEEMKSEKSTMAELEGVLRRLVEVWDTDGKDLPPNAFYKVVQSARTLLAEL
jgi:hypothetical protein